VTAGKKTSRWQSIAREACKQCRRNVIPNVHQPHSWDELWGNCGEKTVVIMLYENEAQTKLRDVIRTQKEQMQTEKTMLLVGPEGGFSKAEVEAAQSRGVLMAGLGPRILRTETASLAALSIILYELGDLG
jgi:16S rRNA (uracil1498-N3)-methyltransferase